MNAKEPPRRYGCTYKPHDREATTTVVINGHPRIVCEECYRREITRQYEERAMQARQAEREKSA